MHESSHGVHGQNRGKTKEKSKDHGADNGYRHELEPTSNVRLALS
jgi:hypothetical protein